MSDLGPLRFEPVVVAKPWGGRRLERFGKRLPGEGLFGESWEIADLPPDAVNSSERSRTPVASGPWAGRSLRELIFEHGPALMGSAKPTPDGDFPLLVKILDAREHLSVQVHPDAGYVARHPECRLKTESWYVLDARPGSVLFIGFREGVSMTDVRTRLGSASFVDLLDPIPARAGDFHHLPAGIVHALGAGVMVAEPQTPSDTTFRVYDWTDEYGRAPRALHLDEAVEAVKTEPEGFVSLPPLDVPGVRRLVDTDHYWIREHRSDGEIDPDRSPELRVFQVAAGVVRIGDGEAPAGSTVLVPAVCAAETPVMALEPSTLLEIGLVTRA